MTIPNAWNNINPLNPPLKVKLFLLSQGLTGFNEKNKQKEILLWKDGETVDGTRCSLMAISPDETTSAAGSAK